MRVYAVLVGAAVVRVVVAIFKARHQIVRQPVKADTVIGVDRAKHFRSRAKTHLGIGNKGKLGDGGNGKLCFNAARDGRICGYDSFRDHNDECRANWRRSDGERKGPDHCSGRITVLVHVGPGGASAVLIVGRSVREVPAVVLNARLGNLEGLLAQRRIAPGADINAPPVGEPGDKDKRNSSIDDGVDDEVAALERYFAHD